jgi:hypothetical protein
MIAAVNTAGEKIWFLQVDNPYDYAVGIHPGGPAGVDWLGRILQLEKQVLGDYSVDGGFR